VVENRPGSNIYPISDNPMLGHPEALGSLLSDLEKCWFCLKNGGNGKNWSAMHHG
jgi:hypothetical protein